MSNCEICGKPMPEGEEMFKFHGYSGPCPNFLATAPKYSVSEDGKTVTLENIEDMPDYSKAVAPTISKDTALTSDELDDDHPLWLVNEQIKGLLEGDGADEDHESVLKFLRDTGLPEGTVNRVHKAIVCAEVKND